MSNFAHYSSAESPQKLEACLEVDMLGFEHYRYVLAPQLPILVSLNISSASSALALSSWSPFHSCTYMRGHCFVFCAQTKHNQISGLATHIPRKLVTKFQPTNYSRRIAADSHLSPPGHKSRRCPQFIHISIHGTYDIHNLLSFLFQRTIALTMAMLVSWIPYWARN